jgi:hypothetical protein
LSADFVSCQQIPSADFCRQQTSFLSADSISKFLSSADFFFVSKCLCRRHLNDAHAGIVRFVPACFLTEKFSPSAGAHFRFYHDSIRFAGPSRKQMAYTILVLVRTTGSTRLRCASRCSPLKTQHLLNISHQQSIFSKLTMNTNDAATSSPVEVAEEYFIDLDPASGTMLDDELVIPEEDNESQEPRHPEQNIDVSLPATSNAV